MTFKKGQSGNPRGRAIDQQAWTDAIRAAVNVVDKREKRKKLLMLADKLVVLALAGNSWAFQEIGNRLDGRPKERTEHLEQTDHTIRIIWPGMPTRETIGSRHTPEIPAEETVRAIPPPDTAVGDNRGSSAGGQDSGDDQRSDMSRATKH